MSKLCCAVSALTFLIAGIPTVSAQTQGQWIVTGAMQSPREFGAQVLLPNGHLLAIGGVDTNLNALATAEVYRPSLRTWVNTGSMVQARERFSAVVLKTGQVLVVGGLGAGNTVLGEAELYNPATGTWTSTGVGSLSVPRFGHTATLLPSGKVLVTGGCTSNDPCVSDTTTSELYDPTTKKWSATGKLHTARVDHTAVLLKTGKVLVIGGSSGTNTSCELYDPVNGTWSNAGSTYAGRYLNTTTLLPNGKVLVTGGRNVRNYPITSAELYDPTHNTWTTTGSMTTSRYAHSATLLGDGTVVVAGGYEQSGLTVNPTAKVDVYNEATGKFTATANLSRALAYQSATLLPQGVALVAGGIGTTLTCCVVVNTAEYYAPRPLALSASSLNFGFLQVGLTSSTKTVKVTNVGNSSVIFSSSTHSGDFNESNNCLGTLLINQSCTVTVSFSPSTAGPKSGTVTLNDNAPGSPQQTIALSGTGGAGALTFTVASLNLGSVTPPGSRFAYATLINDSAGAVNITGVSIAPTGAFTSTNNCPLSGTLNPQQTCVFQVTFKPPDTGSFSATLTVTDGGKGSPATLLLSGTGLD